MDSCCSNFANKKEEVESELVIKPKRYYPPLLLSYTRQTCNIQTTQGHKSNLMYRDVMGVRKPVKQICCHEHCPSQKVFLLSDFQHPTDNFWSQVKLES